MPATASMTPGEGQEAASSSVSPHEWQGPSHMGCLPLLLPGHSQGAVLEVEQVAALSANTTTLTSLPPSLLLLKEKKYIVFVLFYSCVLNQLALFK